MCSVMWFSIYIKHSKEGNIDQNVSPRYRIKICWNIPRYNILCWTSRPIWKLENIFIKFKPKFNSKEGPNLPHLNIWT
ncbi:hypothetical protein M8J77_012638 [Diaphorina citri]|nr:hypothetical protein M8J77_012638 [Diaphorina citri]